MNSACWGVGVSDGLLKVTNLGVSDLKWVSRLANLWIRPSLPVTRQRALLFREGHLSFQAIAIRRQEYIT